MLQRVALCCSVLQMLQCVSDCCSVLQYHALSHLHVETLSHTLWRHSHTHTVRIGNPAQSASVPTTKSKKQNATHRNESRQKQDLKIGQVTTPMYTRTHTHTYTHSLTHSLSLFHTCAHTQLEHISMYRYFLKSIENVTLTNVSRDM